MGIKKDNETKKLLKAFIKIIIGVLIMLIIHVLLTSLFYINFNFGIACIIYDLMLLFTAIYLMNEILE